MRDLSFSKTLTSRLRVKHLDLFRRVMELQSLRRAADACSMTQPAATKLVRELEEMFDAGLFLRGKRGMQPTHHAEVLQRHVAVLIADLARTEEAMALAAQGGSGHVRVGVLPSLAPGLLTQSVVRLLAAYPRLRFSIQEANTNELLESLARNELDVTFGRVVERSVSEELRLVEVYDEPFAIVARAGHPMARLRLPDWKTLSQAVWILPAAASPMRLFINGLFSQHRAFRPVVAVECSTLEKVHHLIAGSDMLGLLPRSFALRGKAAGELAIIKRDLGKKFVPVSLISRGHVQRPPALDALEKMVCAVAGELGLRRGGNYKP
jgi:DNA-binding transcriptional LysR family regulator